MVRQGANFAVQINFKNRKHKCKKTAVYTCYTQLCVVSNTPKTAKIIKVILQSMINLRRM